jgi:hypothetical protein
MLDSQLIETLRQLDKEELKKLERFVNSSFFFHEDNAKGVVALFADIMRFAPTFSSDELQREAVASRLKQTPQYISKLVSNLQQVVRKFIVYVYDDISHDDFFEQLNMLKFYRKKGLLHRFDNLNQRLSKVLDTQKNKQPNEDYYRKRVLLQFEVSTYSKQYNLSNDHNNKAVIEALDEYYWILRSKFMYELIKRSKNIDINTTELATVIEDINYTQSKAHLKNLPLLELFQQAILLIQNNKKMSLEKFEYMVEAQRKNLAYEDYAAFSGIVRNLFQIRFNEGDYSLVPILFDTYRHHLYRGLLFREGYLQPFIFGNIVRNGCRAGKLKWVETFLKLFRHRIGGTINPEAVYQLFYAFFLIYNGQHKEAETYLAYDFEDILLKTDARRFELMSLYLSNDTLLDYKIDSFRKFLQNSVTLPEVHRTQNHNFALTLRKIINPDLKYNDKRIEKIIAEINTLPTSESIWLGQKLGKLKRKK